MNREYHYIREGQPGSELITFVVSAHDLIALAKVERFNETEVGVERKLNYTHVLGLVDFMRKPNASLAEPILGDLRGGWELDQSRQVLAGQNGVGISIDDGQHRIAALQLLSPEERSRWEFKVTATVNTPFAERCRRFIQQLKRLKLDTHLVWQIQDRADLFPDSISKIAYGIAKRLATRPDSPLYGLIRMEERVPRREPAGADAETLKSLIGSVPPATALREGTLGIVNVSGIMRDLRLIVASPHSCIRSYPEETQYEILSRLFNSAKETWPDEWNNPKQHFLRRADGLAGLIQLFVVGNAFKQCLTTTGKTSNKRITQTTRIFNNQETFTRVLGYASRYNWSLAQFRPSGTKFPRPPEIARQLDSLIYEKMPTMKRPPKHEKETAAGK